MAGDFSMRARRNAAVLPLFDRSMMASAPSSRATSTFFHSSASQATSPEIPKFTFTFVRRPPPTPSGMRLAWWMFAGMAMRPAATPSRMNSGSRPSFSATARMAGVTAPARAWSICVTGAGLPRVAALICVIELPSLALPMSGSSGRSVLRRFLSACPAAHAACKLPGMSRPPRGGAAPGGAARAIIPPRPAFRAPNPPASSTNR